MEDCYLLSHTTTQSVVPGGILSERCVSRLGKSLLALFNSHTDNTLRLTLSLLFAHSTDRLLSAGVLLS